MNTSLKSTTHQVFNPVICTGFRLDGFKVRVGLWVGALKNKESNNQSNMVKAKEGQWN